MGREIWERDCTIPGLVYCGKRRRTTGVDSEKFEEMSGLTEMTSTSGTFVDSDNETADPDDMSTEEMKVWIRQNQERKRARAAKRKQKRLEKPVTTLSKLPENNRLDSQRKSFATSFVIKSLFPIMKYLTGEQVKTMDIGKRIAEKIGIKSDTDCERYRLCIEILTRDKLAQCRSNSIRVIKSRVCHFLRKGLSELAFEYLRS
jgi:hypothetical protein